MSVFTHLLVPLDGSRMAESALPAAGELAGRMGAKVTLLHVLEQGAPETVHGDRHLSRPDEAVTYLAQTAQWLASRGLAVSFIVHQQEGGDVAEAIASRGAEIDADLVVLCTHGRGGVRGLLFGPVAQQVLRRGRIPVFLVQPSDGREQTFVCRRLLVPLDGSDTAEAAQPPASAVAGAFTAEMLLMWVVPTVVTISGERAAVSRLMPTAAAVLLDTEAEQAARYLDGMVQQVRAEGKVASAIVARGEPVRTLLDAASQRDVDLIVMATHGRSGVSAVWAGSVASRIIAHSTRPVLLIRIPRRALANE